MRQSLRSERALSVSAVAVSLLTAILCILSQPIGIRAQSSADSSVDEVLSLYDQGKFSEAELTALRLLQGSEVLPPVDRALLHRTLGFIYVATRDNEKAKSQFLSWLEIDPRADLDSVYVSPKIISVFRQAQAEYSAAAKPAKLPENPELRLQLRAIQRSLLFPGLGQLYRGDLIKGYALMGSELALLGALLYSQMQYNEKRDAYMRERNPNLMQDRYDEMNLFFRARYAAAFLAAAVYSYSLIDAAYVPPSAYKNPTLSFSFQPDANHMLCLSCRF